MHGCTGLSDLAKRDINLLAKAGLTVIAPDSLATGRKVNCDFSTKGDGRLTTGMGHNADVYSLRLDEIAYATAQLKAAYPSSKYVLMGHSEGGQAAGRYRGTEYRAVIISGWDCHPGRTHGGPAVPKSTPVMAVNSPDHEWTPMNWRGACKRELSSWPIHEVIDVPGKLHAIPREVFPRVVAFIYAHAR
jgi:dienelactone hydrolase